MNVQTLRLIDQTFESYRPCTFHSLIMLTTEMSAVQQRTRKLQQIISDVPLDDAKLQSAFRCQIYDSDTRRVSFLKVFSRQYGLGHHSSSVSPSRSSSDITSRSSTTFVDHHAQVSAQSHRRTLVIFIRHFLCGNCQEYLLRLSSHPLLSRSNLAKHNLSVAIIGCGSPSHIVSYRALTKIPEDWGMYADPSTELYNSLGMQRSLKLGDRRPVYIQRTLTGNMLRSVIQGVKRMPKGDVGKAGAWDINGGEFLFESRSEDDWRLRWCHQMENSRDHTEVEDLISVLGLNPMPNSPASPAWPESATKVHNRSYSSPLLTEANPSPNIQLEPQTPLKRRYSLRQKVSAKRQSWLARSTSISAGLKRYSLAEINAT